jgi:hypothetical protein
MKINRKAVFVVLFILAIANFNRLEGNDSIRTIQFISIFVIGALAALLVREVIETSRKK